MAAGNGACLDLIKNYFFQIVMVLFFYISNVLTILCMPDQLNASLVRDGCPSALMVLLKVYSEEGFCFFTNYESRKDSELQSLCLVFYWEPLNRQIRIEGTAERILYESSRVYFHSRPKSIQISAVVRRQSTLIPSRQYLRDKNAELEERYKNTEVPVPDYWFVLLLILGIFFSWGNIVKPFLIEIWQGQTSRLHDRIVFLQPKGEETGLREMQHQAAGGWIYQWLSLDGAIARESLSLSVTLIQSLLGLQELAQALTNL